MTHSDKASDLVLGSRNADYGSPAPDFSGIAHIWTGLLNTKLREPITPVEVGLMMVGLKLRRHTHKAKDDNLVDAHGYLNCVEWIETGSRPQPRSDELNVALEDVCCGTKLQCETCGQSKPCICDKGQK